MFRFTIRDVLWLTVVVGMGVGWFLNSRSWVLYHVESTKTMRKDLDDMARDIIKLEMENGTLSGKVADMEIAIDGKDAMLRRLLKDEHRAIQERK
jgi:hypothetical protein